MVWIGTSFPYPCRLAVESILLADPQATVIVVVLDEAPRSKNFDTISRSSRVEVIRTTADEIFRDVPHGAALRSMYDEIPPLAHSARSNLLRYALLWHEGGVYVDFDVIVQRPLPDLAGGSAFVGEERVWRHDNARVAGSWGPAMIPGTVAWAVSWAAVQADCRLLGGRARMSSALAPLGRFWATFQPNNAVIGVPPRSEFIRRVLERALTVDPTVRFALGPTLVAGIVDDHPETVEVLPPDVLYAVPPGESIRFFEDTTLELPPESALIHYVGSNHRHVLPGVRRGDVRFETRPEPFWRLARQVERGETATKPVAAKDSVPVSCLMVTRDRPELARRAVECFADQTYGSRELVIVDDGDIDYTPMLAPYLEAGHRIVYLRRPSRSDLRLGALRNVALDAAASPWCIQWDDDEWYHPTRIEQQMASAGDADAVALRWTLMTVASESHGRLSYRADAGIATPGTILHRRDIARYPNEARGEDSAFLRTVRRQARLNILGAEASHLFVRVFHGDNTWDERHFLARLHRRAADWPSYAAARWWHGDLRRHRAFLLDEREQASIDALLAMEAA